MGEHDEIREAVLIVLAGREGQGLLPGGLVSFSDRGGFAVLIVGIVLQARRVGSEVPEGERLPRLGRVGQVLRQGCVEVELALLHEEHHQRASEDLGGGGDLERGIGPDLRLGLQVRETVCGDLLELAVANDGQGHTGDMVLLHDGMDVVVHERRGRAAVWCLGGT